MCILWMKCFTNETREEMEAIVKENKCIEEVYKRLDSMS